MDSNNNNCVHVMEKNNKWFNGNRIFNVTRNNKNKLSEHNNS